MDFATGGIVIGVPAEQVNVIVENWIAPAR
jgi:hypothetical protein